MRRRRSIAMRRCSHLHHHCHDVHVVSLSASRADHWVTTDPVFRACYIPVHIGRHVLTSLTSIRALLSRWRHLFTAVRLMWYSFCCCCCCWRWCDDGDDDDDDDVLSNELVSTPYSRCMFAMQEALLSQRNRATLRIFWTFPRVKSKLSSSSATVTVKCCKRSRTSVLSATCDGHCDTCGLTKKAGKGKSLELVVRLRGTTFSTRIPYH